jgi:hypothetical protein
MELARDNGGETFIGLSSGACDGVKAHSARLYPVHPEVHLCSRECILRIMLSETFEDLDPWHAFIGAEFDYAGLFNFRHFDIFCPTNSLLLTKFAR